METSCVPPTFPVPCGASIKDNIKFDLVLIFGGFHSEEYKNAEVFSWLRRLGQSGVVIGGISGGPLIMAAAGILAGRRCTVHWEHMARFEALYPRIAVEKAIYVIDRDRITCAGGVAPLDLLNAIIGEHRGHEFACRVSDWFLHTTVRAPGSAQRAGISEHYGVYNRHVLSAIGRMQNSFGNKLSLGDIAQHVGLSPRQLNRLFNQYFGVGVVAFFRNLRLELAARLLRQSELTITQVAYATGFSSGAHFSSAFKQKYNASPSQFASRYSAVANH